MDSDKNRVDEIWTFSPVQSPPLKDMPVKMVATGTSHAMAVGGTRSHWTAVTASLIGQIQKPLIGHT